jgi:hypothetical protein
MDPTVQLNPIIVGYSPNDFFYYTAYEQTDIESCNNIKHALGKTDCNNPLALTDISYALCYRNGLCQNRSYSDWFRKVQTNHSGADERYKNTSKIYNANIQTTVNLSAGILGVLAYIYANK